MSTWSAHQTHSISGGHCERCSTAVREYAITFACPYKSPTACDEAPLMANPIIEEREIDGVLWLRSSDVVAKTAEALAAERLAASEREAALQAKLDSELQGAANYRSLIDALRDDLVVAVKREAALQTKLIEVAELNQPNLEQIMTLTLQVQALQAEVDRLKVASNQLAKINTTPDTTDATVLSALSNCGIDTTCGACMEIAWTGVTSAQHSCKRVDSVEQARLVGSLIRLGRGRERR